MKSTFHSSTRISNIRRIYERAMIKIEIPIKWL
jgi:hypothetical protein